MRHRTGNLHRSPPNVGLYARRRLTRGNSPSTVTGGEFPTYLCHEPPDEGDGLTGWAVFVGDESPADANDASQFHITAVSTMTNAHPALLQVLRWGVTGAWEWDDAVGRCRPLPEQLWPLEGSGPAGAC